MKKITSIALVIVNLVILNIALSIVQETACDMLALWVSSWAPAVMVVARFTPAVSNDYGRAHADDGKCIKCDGSGKCHVCSGTGKNTSGDNCSICSGTGKCYYCSGTGKS